MLAYADDITIITKNDEISVNNIFIEYDKLSIASGLYLNADKTDKFNVHSRNTGAPVRQQNITYNGTQLEINSIP